MVADPGWLLVVADAAQLEPRVLAAISGDRGWPGAAGGDLYAALAADAFGGDRAKAKVALLGAMYGQTGGDAAPAAGGAAAPLPGRGRVRGGGGPAGEEGRLVRSWLGRTCPPPSPRWREAQERAALPGAAEPERRQRPATARARGRFTRNFVVQATAADWALVLLAALRRRLLGRRARRRAGLLPARRGDRALPGAGRAEVVGGAHRGGARRRAGCCSATRPVRFPLERVRGRVLRRRRVRRPPAQLTEGSGSAAPGSASSPASAKGSFPSSSR